MFELTKEHRDLFYRALVEDSWSVKLLKRLRNRPPVSVVPLPPLETPKVAAPPPPPQGRPKTKTDLVCIYYDYPLIRRTA